MLEGDKSKGVDCFDQEKSAITHKSAMQKAEITLKWRAPQGFRGTFRFMATVVKEYRTFWVCVSTVKDF